MDQQLFIRYYTNRWKMDTAVLTRAVCYCKWLRRKCFVTVVVVVTQVYAFVKIYRTAHLKGSDLPHINFTSIK